MPCIDLQKELTRLRAQREDQEMAVEMLPPHKKELAQAVLDSIIADINATQAALNLCLAQEAQEENPVPQRILATVEKIKCYDAGKEVGADEPYLLIASFDMTQSVDLGIVRLPLPAVNVVKVGPWGGVHSGETHHASLLSGRPPFWNLSGEATPIARPEDVIFLVAFMEHDGSSPDGIRGAVRDALLAARATNTNLSYQAYVTNMVSNMTATIDTARLVLVDKVGVNFDDRVGEVQHLHLATHELATLNRIQPVTKTLRFTKKKSSGGPVENDYSATFSFTVP